MRKFSWETALFRIRRPKGTLCGWSGSLILEQVISLTFHVAGCQYFLLLCPESKIFWLQCGKLGSVLIWDWPCTNYSGSVMVYWANTYLPFPNADVYLILIKSRNVFAALHLLRFLMASTIWSLLLARDTVEITYLDCLCAAVRLYNAIANLVPPSRMESRPGRSPATAPKEIKYLIELFRPLALR